MEYKLFIGFDNGTTGTIGFIREGFAAIVHTPAFMVRDYQKPTKRKAKKKPDADLEVEKGKANRKSTKKNQEWKYKNITRLNFPKLVSILDLQMQGFCKSECIALIERPMVNSKRFSSTGSALRCHEALLNALDYVGVKYEFIDSKEWQGALLPDGCEGEELKTESYKVGKALYPDLTIKHPDMDGLLIAEYASRKEWPDAY